MARLPRRQLFQEPIDCRTRKDSRELIEQMRRVAHLPTVLPPEIDPAELPMPAEQLVCVLHALIEGLVLQRILTPELCTDQMFYAAFAAFGRGSQAARGHESV